MRPFYFPVPAGAMGLRAARRRGFLAGCRRRQSSLIASLAAAPAIAGWEKVDGGVTAKPDETNSTIEAMHIHCLEGPAIDVYSHDLGPVRPLDGGAEPDYFYKPGMISADVDGKQFPLVAAGSDDAVVLFSQGERGARPISSRSTGAVRGDGRRPDADAVVRHLAGQGRRRLWP